MHVRNLGFSASRPARRAPTAPCTAPSPAGRTVAVFASACAKPRNRARGRQRPNDARSASAPRMTQRPRSPPLAADHRPSVVVVAASAVTAAYATTSDSADHKHTRVRASPPPMIANARRNHRAHWHAGPEIQPASGLAARTRSAGSRAPSAQSSRLSARQHKQRARVRRAPRARAGAGAPRAYQTRLPTPPIARTAYD